MKKTLNGTVESLPDRLPNQLRTFSWLSLVQDANFTTANVSSFKHAPMSEFWDRLITVGIKVEVINTDVDTSQINIIHNAKSKANSSSNNISNSNKVNDNDVKISSENQATQLKSSSKKSSSSSNSKLKKEKQNEAIKREVATEKVYWIATVIRVCGYLAKLRYEGYEEDGSHDFWVYLFDQDIHGVGWCATQGKALVPPKTILRKLPDWTMYLIKKLTGSRTLPANFEELINDSLKTRFKKGMKLEVVDKNRVSAVRVATVEMTVGGRLLVSYDGAEPEQAGFWTHEKSALVHPVGWAQFVSHELVATYDYARESLEKVHSKKFSPEDATWDLFDLPSNEPHPSGERFEVNMKLEAIDPLNLSSICVATVIKVLRANYLMIGIDGTMCPTGSDWFCFHAASPNIFPAGFCESNGIELSTPNNDKNFDWNDYLSETHSRAAPPCLFKRPVPEHGFKEGMMIEAVDLMQSRLVCVATITRVVGRLLRIHFNGWDDTYDQWCDCESPDLFPLGWCELVGYPLEPPRSEDTNTVAGSLASSGGSNSNFKSPIDSRGGGAGGGSGGQKRRKSSSGSRRSGGGSSGASNSKRKKVQKSAAPVATGTK